MLRRSRREWGREIPVDLVRDFIYVAVQQPAVAAFVSEYAFDAIDTDAEPEADIAEALRVAIHEVIDAARADDWERVGRDVIAWARASLEPASDAAVGSPWPGSAPPEVIVVGQRKHPVRIDAGAILAWIDERRCATLREIAEHFNISEGSARRKADGLVYVGKFTVIAGSERCYSIAATSVPPESSGAAVGGGLELSGESS
jgi:hypothetical protein